MHVGFGTHKLMQVRYMGTWVCPCVDTRHCAGQRNDARDGWEALHRPAKHFASALSATFEQPFTTWSIRCLILALYPYSWYNIAPTANVCWPSGCFLLERAPVGTQVTRRKTSSRLLHTTTKFRAPPAYHSAVVCTLRHTYNRMDRHSRFSAFET